MLSEARVSKPQQSSLARRAAKLGYQVVWSCSPPPSATTAVPHGGTAIFVKFCFGISELCPPHLHRWHAMGRACAAMVTKGPRSAIVVAMYGFAPSYPLREENLAMCIQISSWITGLTLPTLWAGDFNTSVANSSFLMLTRFSRAVAHFTGLILNKGKNIMCVWEGSDRPRPVQ